MHQKCYMQVPSTATWSTRYGECSSSPEASGVGLFPWASKFQVNATSRCCQQQSKILCVFDIALHRNAKHMKNASSPFRTAHVATVKEPDTQLGDSSVGHTTVVGREQTRNVCYKYFQPRSKAVSTPVARERSFCWIAKQHNSFEDLRARSL